ncbi:MULTISPECIES: hypothetical protein [unclassified Bradyrhizobium]|uniref:hypothetical protein n=1 Tax=unclassified Bradyrhizobium TaxID=2631580 RepID=UPI003390D15E
MTKSAGSQAMACFSEQLAEGREQQEKATAGRLFKSGFEKPVHGDNRAVAESGAWCNELGVVGTKESPDDILRWIGRRP